MGNVGCPQGAGMTVGGKVLWWKGWSRGGALMGAGSCTLSSHRGSQSFHPAKGKGSGWQCECLLASVMRTDLNRSKSTFKIQWTPKELV